MHRSRCWLVFALAASAVPAVSLRADEGASIGDTIIVTSETAQLRRGFDILATLERGRLLKVIRIDGEWIGTAVEFDGVRTGGWINACDVDVVRRPRPLRMAPKKRILNTLQPAPNPIQLEPGASLDVVPPREARRVGGPNSALDVHGLLRLGDHFRELAIRLWAAKSAEFQAATQPSTEPFEAPNPSTSTVLKPK